MEDYTPEQKKLYKRLYNKLADCMNCTPQNFEGMLKEALRQGLPINCRNGCYKYSLLLLSLDSNTAIRGCVPKILLDNGADPDFGGRFGESPLIRAAYRNCPLRLIKKLIAAGADVNAQDCNGNTAFHWTSWGFIYPRRNPFVYSDKLENRWKIANSLLENGADPYLGDDWREELDGDAPDNRVRRRKLAELCEAYLAKRDTARLQETERDLDAFVR